jgi:hypothetical protein
MKRNGEMQRAGVPSAGMRPRKFKGWRKPHWHETRHLDGFQDNGLPIHRYTPEPMYVVHRVRRAKRERAMAR